MLILTRRVGEKLVIGENVTVTVLGVKGNQIRIGIEAPRSINIVREEISDLSASDTLLGHFGVAFTSR
mgnify:CR=1 FL=1